MRAYGWPETCSTVDIRNMSKWRHRFKITVFDEDTFSEVRVVRTTLRRSVVGAAAAVGVIAALVYAIVAQTPLREHVVPGYVSDRTKREMTQARQLADSAWLLLEQNNRVVEAMRHALAGDSTAMAFLRLGESSSWADRPDSMRTASFSQLGNLEVGASEQALRDQVAREDAFSLRSKALGSSSNQMGFPFAPLVGGVSSGLNVAGGHRGVDLVAPDGSAIQAVDDGFVVLNAYTVETGYTMVLQHRGDRLSVYKHCAQLLKQQGDVVSGGEVIALLGNTGELTSGPHLHFEWWVRGQAVDPTPWMGMPVSPL